MVVFTRLFENHARFSQVHNISEAAGLAEIIGPAKTSHDFQKVVYKTTILQPWIPSPLANALL